MARIPNPRSFQQILGDMLDTFLARTGVSDLHEGSAVLSVFEAAAQSDFRSSEDIFAILSAYSIDRASSDTLDRLGGDQGLYRFVASPATGSVTFTDTNFVKLATKIFPGTSAVNAGSTTINVSDASEFPTSGQIFIGRNTSNLEGPLTYTAKTQVGSFWQLTLAVGTTKFHALSESVILKQGSARSIPSGTLVQTAQGNVATATQFQTTVSVVLVDGEDTISGVPVVALGVGSVGNVPRNSVVELPSAPVSNLSVINPLPFVTGTDQESDLDFRARIKKAIQSRVKGTDLAIMNSVIGITSPDEPKRVSSSSIVKQAGYPSKLIIDDSSGYEELTAGVGLVSVVDVALGGEKFLQLPNRAISKALLLSVFESPFSLTAGDTLAVLVGGVRSEHAFAASSFKNISSATSYEVASSINDNSSLLFSAMTSAGGTKVRIFAKSDDNEDLEVVAPSSGIDANVGLGFALFRTHSLNLYKNDTLLYKDGVVPEVLTEPQSSWSNTIASGDTLQLRVDGVSTASTYSIDDIDFVAAGTTFSTASSTNSLESWAAVLNYKIPGITARVSGAQLGIRSNRGALATASVEILGGTLFTSKHMFSSLIGTASIGRASDYEFNRNTGQVSLVVPLVAGDSLTAGSKYTQGHVQTANLTAGLINFASDAHFWVLVDGAAVKINTTISATATIHVSNSGNVWRYRVAGDTTAFSNVSAGDWAVIWDPSITHANNRGFWRVCDSGVQGGTDAYIEVEKTSGTSASYTLGTTGVTPGIIVVRSTEPMQQITIPSGISTLAALVVIINNQLIGATASVVESDNIKLTTLSRAVYGEIMFVTTDMEGRRFLFADGDVSQNGVSHVAFVESGNSDLGTPLFAHDVVATGNTGEPPTAFVSTIDYGSTASADPNDQIGFLRPYAVGRFSSNHYNYIQMKNLSALNITINSKKTVHEILPTDRTFVARPYDFGSEDTLIAEIDQDAVNKTFTVPMARRVSIKRTPNAPSSTDFDIYDLDRGPTADPLTTFGAAFKFDNFKLWMHARNLIKPSSGTKNAIIFRSVDFGPSGNLSRVGYFYPAFPDADFSSAITTGKYTSIQIYLPSGSAITTDATLATEFDITKSGGGPYVVVYSHNGTGPSPLFVTSGVAVGDIVTDTFSANHQGTYRITARDEVSLTISRSTDPGTNETGVALGDVSLFRIYPLDVTAIASGVVAHVASNLSSHLTAVLAPDDPIGTHNDGSGAITKSTEDELGSTGPQYVSLVDGENWVLNTSLATHPALELKTPLTCINSLYFLSTELAAEEMRLIPTTADQLSRYLNVLGTSGLSDVAGVSTSSHGNSLQISSEVLGSIGAVQITGGTANSTLAAIIGSGLVVDTDYTTVRIPLSLKQGFHAKQFIRTTATTLQPKALGFDPTTELEVVAGLFGAPNTIEITGGTGSFQTIHSHSGDETTEYLVEKQGKFLCVSFNGTGTSPAYSAQIEGDWVSLRGGFSPVNQGTFRVVRRYLNSFYVENPIGIEETSSATYASYLGIPAGASSSVLIVADSLGAGGNAITLTFNGSNTIAQALATWNVSYPSNTATVVSGSDSQVPTSGSITLSGGGPDIEFVTYDSVVVGDALRIGGTILDSDNAGDWVVTKVNGSTMIETSGVMVNAGPTVLGASLTQAQIIEQAPFSSIKRIHMTAVNPTDPTQLDVVLDGTVSFEKLTEGAGTTLSTIDKLGFSNNINLGLDGYNKYLGLIAEANRIVYGDPTNYTTYPGVAASGAYLNIEGPIIKRIFVSMAVRVRTGIPFSVVQSQIKSNVTSVINKTPVGTSIVISDLVTAAGKVLGVLSVSIVSPLYDDAHDLIAISAVEKPLVIDPDVDVLVSQIGG